MNFDKIDAKCTGQTQYNSHDNGPLDIRYDVHVQRPNKQAVLFAC